jgi:uncharacterized repeat protein (TIGR04138 family)
MTKEPSPHHLLTDLCRRDPRYPFEAYEFIYAALGYIQQELKKQGKSKEGPNHITGQQYARGCRDFALQEFGLMAGTVMKSWNIHSTADFGEMVYNLIGLELMSKTETDSKEDFHNVFDFEKEFTQGFRFSFE